MKSILAKLKNNVLCKNCLLAFEIYRCLICYHPVIPSFLHDVRSVFDSEHHELRVFVAPVRDEGKGPSIAAESQVGDGAVEEETRQRLFCRCELPNVEKQVGTTRHNELVVARDYGFEHLHKTSS